MPRVRTACGEEAKPKERLFWEVKVDFYSQLHDFVDDLEMSSVAGYRESYFSNNTFVDLNRDML